MIISKDEILKSISKHGWSFVNNSITKQYKFKTYMDGINFVNKIAIIAERKNHHPDISIGWCQINLIITSHDLGGVTTNCINLAIDIDNTL